MPFFIYCFGFARSFHQRIVISIALDAILSDKTRLFKHITEFNELINEFNEFDIGLHVATFTNKD